MNEDLNELVAYLIIGLVALFVVAAAVPGLIRDVHTFINARRNRRTLHHPAWNALSPDKTPAPQGVTIRPESEVEQSFAAIDRRLNRLRANIEAIDALYAEQRPTDDLELHGP